MQADLDLNDLAVTPLGSRLVPIPCCLDDRRFLESRFVMRALAADCCCKAFLAALAVGMDEWSLD
jgi:hypothetical protein